MTRLLDRIDRPQDLHGLSEERARSRSPRRSASTLIDTVGEIGGHFGANLGTCEIAVALHSLLDSPRDKILWDVGHQAYPHKVLTGRRDRLDTIRQYDGLAPFCSIFESEHDIMGAGHASTSIGYAVGIKEAMRRGDGEDGRVVAVDRRRRDDRRRGLRGRPPGRRPGHADRRRAQRQRHVDRARTSARCRATSTACGSTPACGRRARASRSGSPGCRAASARRSSASAPSSRSRSRPSGRPACGGRSSTGPTWASSTATTCARCARALQRGLRGRAAGRRPRRDRQGQGLRARRGRRPRGHGEVARRQAQVDRQGACPRRPRLAGRAKPRRRSTRRSSATRWSPSAGATTRVVGITAAMNSGTGLSDPAEGDARALLRRRDRRAAGAAVRGRPRAAGRAPGRRDLLDLPPARATTRSSTTSACSRCRSCCAMDRAGLVGDDGPTHHGAFDIAYLRCLPNITLMAPRDEAMLVHMLHTALRHDDGPVGHPLPARRGGRRAAARRARADRHRHRRDPARGRARGARRLRLGRRQGARRRRPAGRAAASTSPSPTPASPSRSTPGCSASSPPSTTCWSPSRRACWRAASAPPCWECLSEDGAAPRILRVGLPDRYVTHGTPALLHEEVGFTAERIAERIEAASCCDPGRGA